MPLEDIARNVQMNMEDLMEELNIIVSSGTRININYYIKDSIDESIQEEILISSIQQIAILVKTPIKI